MLEKKFITDDVKLLFILICLRNNHLVFQKFFCIENLETKNPIFFDEFTIILEYRLSLYSFVSCSCFLIWWILGNRELHI